MSDAAASMSVAFGHKVWRMLDVRAPLALSSAIAVALSWALYGRGEMSLDEGYTLAETHLPLNQLVEVIWRREMNGSLHTLISWALINRMNLDSVAPIRVLSSVFMIAAIWIFALIIANLYGSQYSAWAALLFASPLVLQQMVDARTYALTLMLTAASVWILTSAQNSESIARIAAWSVVNGLLVYAHFFGLAVIAGECVWLASQRPRHRTRWIVGLGGTLAMSIPLFVFLLSPGAHQHQLLPHPPFDARDYLAQLLALILGDESKGQRALQLLAALILVTVIVVLARTRTNRRATFLPRRSSSVVPANTWLRDVPVHSFGLRPAIHDFVATGSRTAHHRCNFGSPVEDPATGDEGRGCGFVRHPHRIHDWDGAILSGLEASNQRDEIGRPKGLPLMQWSRQQSLTKVPSRATTPPLKVSASSRHQSPRRRFWLRALTHLADASVHFRLTRRPSCGSSVR